MKEYEIYSNLKVPKESNVILRLDGRNFHRLSNNLNLKKPYDDGFIKSMVLASKEIFKEFSPLFIYTFSDEINILLSEIPFSGRIEKLNSVFPSLTSSAFLKHLENSFNSFNISNIYFISFDSRVIPIAKEKGIVDYFKWRQDESWRNCVNSYGYWTLRKDFSAKEASEKLKSLKSQDIHQLLFENGINLNDLPNYQKRGVAIYKRKKKIFVDKELPIFNIDFYRKINIL